VATQLQPNVFADRIFKQNSLLKDALLVLGGSLFIALLAQVEIPLIPVPITGQTLGVLLIGMLLGPWRGAFSLMLYLTEGAVGLPFFAGGAAGVGVLSGATGGYLMGFVFAAFVTGWLAQRGWDRHFLKTALIMLVGNLVIYIPGLLWLNAVVSSENVFAIGLYPFIVGDLIKLALAAALMPSLWRMFGETPKTSN
jgi:biotin transport system substrate-specific component